MTRAPTRRLVPDRVLEQCVEGLLLGFQRRTRVLNSGGASFVQFQRVDEQIETHVDALRICDPEGSATRALLSDAETPEQIEAGLALDAELSSFSLAGIAAVLPDQLPSLIEGLAPGPYFSRGWPNTDPLSHCTGRARLFERIADAFHEPAEARDEQSLRVRATARCLSLTAHAEAGDAAGLESTRSRGGAAVAAAAPRLVLLETLVLRARPRPTLESLATQLALIEPDLCLRLLTLDDANAILSSLADSTSETRALIRGTGIVGDPWHITWLIERMGDANVARLAGESFSMITGADLALLDLDRKPPEDFESGPNDDPNDPNVEMDEDEGLPWPDPEKVAAWWKANEHRFPAGQRFFMGAPPSMAHCLQVLKTGYQRQRMAAAIWRCILQPGTPLFPTDAPAWRQKRWLAQMTA